MSRRRAVQAALAVLYLLHNDIWLWHDPRLVAGLPAGLAYHVGFAVVSAVLLALAVRWAWPRGLAEEVEP